MSRPPKPYFTMRPLPLKKVNESATMKNLVILIRREFALFYANKIFLAAFLLLPLLLSMVNGFVYRKGRVTDQPIVVVDRDISPSSQQFRQAMEDNNVLHIVKVVHESQDLHQLLLDYKAIGVVIIPYRFEADLLQQRRPEVNCYLNMANTITSGAVSGALSANAAAMNLELVSAGLLKKGLPASAAANNLAFKPNTFFQYNPAGNYLYFLWPGLIFATLHQLLLLALAVSFSGEVDAGTFNRQGLLGYSISPLVLIMAKVIPYLCLSFFTLGIYFLLSLLFRVPLPEHMELLFFSQFLMVLGACFLSVLYSLIYPVPLKASQLLMSIATPAFTLSGFTWPVAQAPVLLSSFGKIVPLTPYLKLLRMALLQGAGWGDCQGQLFHQLILLAVYFSLAVVLLHSKIRKIIKAPTILKP